MKSIGVGGFKGTPAMAANVLAVLESGRLSYGEYSVEFERRFAELHDSKYAILSNSGTSALLVALQALKEQRGFPDGSEVIVPATTFVATSNIVLHCNLVPVFVDIDYNTLNINPDLIQEAITEKTVAIIAVHLCGLPAEMERIMAIANVYGLVVIEDSCEAMFVQHKGRKVGSWGHVGCFSTYVAHVITTGVGGICTTSIPGLAMRIRSLVNHGLDFEYLNADDDFKPRPMGNRRFQFSSIGHSFRLTELEAAIGLPQLDTWEETIKARRRNAAHLAAGLKIINGWAGTGETVRDPFHVFEPGSSDLLDHSWMIYPILLNPDLEGRYRDKEPLMTWLNKHGVETRDLMPLLGQPAEPYKSLDPYDFMSSRWVWKSGFYVGCHQYLEPEDIQSLLSVISNYFDQGRFDS